MFDLVALQHCDSNADQPPLFIRPSMPLSVRAPEQYLASPVFCFQNS